MARKAVYGLLAVSLVVILIASLTASYNFQQSSEKVESLDTEVSSLRDDFEQAQRDQSATTEKLSTIDRDLSAAREELAALSKASPENVYEQTRLSTVLIIATGLQGTSRGSGFLYSSNYIVTNFHVIQGTYSIEVEFFDGSSRIASLVGQDPFADLAVLAVANPPQAAKILQFSDSTDLRVGQQVVENLGQQIWIADDPHIAAVALDPKTNALCGRGLAVGFGYFFGESVERQRRESDLNAVALGARGVE